MSVIKSKRGLSRLQFLENAKDIYVMCLRYCENMPKKHYHYLQEPFMKLIAEMFTQSKTGNSIYASNVHEQQLRIDCFLKAYSALQAAISYLGIMQDMSLLTERQLINLTSKMSEELKLIKGVLDAERKRRKEI